MGLGLTDFQAHTVWPGNTTPALIPASTLCGWTFANTAAAARFVKLYDKATSPVVGTDAPVRVIQLGASQNVVAEFLRGKRFQNKMWVSVTQLVADSDTTAPVAGDVIVGIDHGGALPLNSADNQFRANWPANTTPQAPDGSGAKRATLCGFGLTNTVAAAVRFVKFYNKATAPSVGTDTPVRTVELPAASTVYGEFFRGKDYTAGLWVSVTQLAADSDTTAPGAGDVLMTVDWQ